jgi:hypothetical protein
MSTPFTGEILAISNMKQDREIKESGQSVWQTFATYIVSLQSRQVGEQIDRRTIVYFLEADKRQIWPGVECDGVCKFMLEQLEPILQVTPREAVAMDSTTERPPKATTEMSSETNGTSDLTEESADLTSEGALDDPIPAANQEAQLLETTSQMSPLAQPEANETSELTAQDYFDFSTVGISESPLEEESVPGKPEKAAELTVEGESAPDETLELVDKGESERTPDKEREEPIKLEITQLKVCQPMKTEKIEIESAETDKKKETVTVLDGAKQALFGELTKEKPFDLEVTFQLSGTGAIELTKQPFRYHSEVYGHNRVTRKDLTLGYAPVGTLVDGELIYTCRLPNLTLLEAGPYRLQIITRLEGAPVRPDLLELPFVQVA